MFAGIRNASALFASILQVPLRHPAMLGPLLLAWCVFAPVTVYLYFYFPWSETGFWTGSAVLFGALFLISYVVSLANFVLLEQIRMVESGSAAELLWPIRVAVSNSLRALHVTLIWAILWFLISLAEAILSPKGDDQRSDEPDPEAVARLLSGAQGGSLSNVFFDALKQGVRMLAFLVYPAVAWERDRRPLRRGLAVALAHRAEFAAGFGLAWMAAGVVFLPPALVFMLSEQTDVPFPDWVWFAVILYSGFAWSFSILVEQLFTAELYLWDMKWREACAAEGAPALKLGDVPRPSIMDDVSEFKTG
ncbi:MAG: hypothetical protein ACFE0P_04305 [Oceanicaulis sp.]